MIQQVLFLCKNFFLRNMTFSYPLSPLEVSDDPKSISNVTHIISTAIGISSARPQYERVKKEEFILPCHGEMDASVTWRIGCFCHLQALQFVATIIFRNLQNVALALAVRTRRCKLDCPCPLPATCQARIHLEFFFFFFVMMIVLNLILL